MTAILDIILATIAGSIVILTILFSIFNVQQMSYNTQIILALSDHATKSAEVLASEYMERAGRHITAPTPVFTQASSVFMRFNTQDEFWTPVRDLRIQWASISAPDVGTIDVHEDMVGRLYDTDPYFVRSPRYRYFDETYQELDVSIPANLALIRSCRATIVFCAPGWERGATLQDMDDPQIQIPITFWSFFKNAYISSP